MKKIMFVAAVAAALAASADGIQSSNTVGYGQNGLRFGYSLVTPQFTGIGGTALSLDALQGVGSDASDNVNLAMVDEYGAAITTYTWNDWAAAEPCWVDDSYAPVSDVTVSAGQAFWTGGSSSDQLIRSAGEVCFQDVVVSLRFGYTLVGNPFPVSLALQDIVAGGDEASDNVTMATIDEYGAAITTYTWNDWAAAEPCWVDDSYAPVTDVTFAPGEGLWTGGSNNSQFVRFPAPEL